jgi:hypothetical protein
MINKTYSNILYLELRIKHVKTACPSLKKDTNETVDTFPKQQYKENNK